MFSSAFCVIRRRLFFGWNWKAALLGAILRASFYFTVYKASKENWVVTMTAVGVEVAFSFFDIGISGALVQSFRRARPVWAATLLVSISLPIFSHSVQFFTHYAQEKYFSTIFAAAENNARQKAFAISVLFSVLSALFNLFMMRHGVLLVGAGEETNSLWDDLKKIPVIGFGIYHIFTVENYQFSLKKNILQGVSDFLFIRFNGRNNSRHLSRQMVVGVDNRPGRVGCIIIYNGSGRADHPHF